MSEQNCVNNEFLNNVTNSTSVAGSTCLTSISNPDNSNTASHAIISISTGGAGGGDPYLHFTNNVANWTIGIDNSVSDQLTVAASNALGTSNVAYSTSGGIWRYPLQTAFNAHKDADANDVTGNGANYVPVYNITKMNVGSNYNSANGIYTAPVTGKYLFTNVAYFDGCTVAYLIRSLLTTSNRSYYFTNFRAATPNPGSVGGSVLADMDTGDTAYMTLYTFGEAGNTDDFIGAEINRNHFAGILVT